MITQQARWAFVYSGAAISSAFKISSLRSRIADRSFRVLHLVYTDHQDGAITHNLKHILLSDCVAFDNRQTHPLLLLFFMLLQPDVSLDETALGVHLAVPSSDLAISNLRGLKTSRSRTQYAAVSASTSDALDGYAVPGTQQLRAWPICRVGHLAYFTYHMLNIEQVISSRLLLDYSTLNGSGHTVQYKSVRTYGLGEEMETSTILSLGLLTPPHCFDKRLSIEDNLYAAPVVALPFDTPPASPRIPGNEQHSALLNPKPEAEMLLNVTTLIGSGAVGIVYRAEHMGHIFALKWPMSTDEKLRSFATEVLQHEASMYADRLSPLYDSAVPTYYGLYSSGLRLMMVLDFLGTSLSTFNDLTDLQR